MNFTVEMLVYNTNDGKVGFGRIGVKSPFGRDFALVRPFGFCGDSTQNDSTRFKFIGLSTK